MATGRCLPISRSLYDGLASYGLEATEAFLRGVGNHPSAADMFAGFTDISVPIIPAGEDEETTQRPAAFGQ